MLQTQILNIYDFIWDCQSPYIVSSSMEDILSAGLEPVYFSISWHVTFYVISCGRPTFCSL